MTEWTEETIRAWLEAADRKDDERELIDEFPAYTEPNWHHQARALVWDAASSDGPLEHVRLWLASDSEGVIDGALVTVDLPSGVRLSSLHQEYRDLTDDSEATGIEGALAVIRVIRRTADLLVAEHERHFERKAPRVSFSAEAIREHFDGTEDEMDVLALATDEEIEDVAKDEVFGSHDLWETYGDVCWDVAREIARRRETARAGTPARHG